jgi:hypothetical protein
MRLLQRIGSACAILGPLVLAASFIPHGDLPTNEASLLDEEAALRFVASHSLWLLAHLGTVAAALLWVGAFCALAGVLAPGPARALGRLLAPSAVLGGVFVVFDYSVDGYALGILAEAWAAAPAADRAELVRMADTALWLLSGTFRAENAIMYGLTVLIAGLAVALDGGFPRWFGWIGAVAGGLVFANAMAAYAGGGLIPAPGADFLLFVIILPIESLWLLALAVMLWRRPLPSGDAEAVEGATAG